MSRKNNGDFYVDIMSESPEVTGSCTIVCVHFPDKKTIHFLVDCGLFQGREYEDLNKEFVFSPSKIDFCVLTHNHIDHVGRVPMLLKKEFTGEIFTSIDTAKLLPISLIDTCKIFKRNNSKCNNKKKKNKVLYEIGSVSKTMQLVKPLAYSHTVRLDNNIDLTLFPNGHIVGSAIVLIQINHYGYEPINLLFSGDYKAENKFFSVPAALPLWVRNLPLSIVCESTYGQEEKKRTKIFTETILDYCSSKKNPTVILPTFAQARTQEVLLALKKVEDKLPQIYLDGNLAQKYTTAYSNLSSIELSDFLPSNLIRIESIDMRKDLLKNTVTAKIIVSSSGMGSYGPSQAYIQNYIQKESLIFFTGYAAEGTASRELLLAGKEDIVTFSGITVQKKAKIMSTTEFSAHAKSDELIEFLSQFHNPKFIMVTHGEEDSKRIFSQKIVKTFSVKTGILSRDTFFRINSYGLVKSMNSHFHF